VVGEIDGLIHRPMPLTRCNKEERSMKYIRNLRNCRDKNFGAWVAVPESPEEATPVAPPVVEAPPKKEKPAPKAKKVKPAIEESKPKPSKKFFGFGKSVD